MADKSTNVAERGRVASSAVHEAIESIRPEVEGREAYMYARTQNPDLVDSETPESRFLAVEDGDVEKAARRLAYYWKCRVDLFEERALLPLDQTGTGALGSKEIEIVRSSAYAITPKDKLGRPVICHNQGNYLPGHLDPINDRARLRQVFYFFSIAAEQPVAQSQGLVCVASVVGQERPLSIDGALKFLRDALPIRHYELHAVFLPSAMSFSESICWTALEMSDRFLSLKLAVQMHRGETDKETLRSLEAAGFDAKSIPVWIGGKLSDQACQEWQDRRVEIERLRKAPVEERELKRRRAEAERSRRNRRSEKHELEALETCIANLEREKERLVGENERLSSLLTQAQLLIRTVYATSITPKWSQQYPFG